MQKFLSDRKPSRIVRAFGDLKVRPKLMVLHNFFFLILATSAYFTLIPLFEQQVEQAKAREISILRQQAPLDAAQMQKLAASQVAYDEVAERARLTLFIVLGVIYVLAVLALEFAIMPLYVYKPLRRMLDADDATRRGDRDHELIAEPDIMEDEIGEIMRSRNSTVAELRRHEDELAAAMAKLEEQDRLVSLGLLSASVAHELNTPLAVLNGSIEKMMETTREPQALERLARMQRVAQRLRRISESLVDFARVRKDRMEPQDARALVDEAWSLVAIDDKALGVRFENQVDAAHAVIGSADRLIQVFVNLLRNALLAVDAREGRITASSRRLDRNRQPFVAIAVSDNGPGIPGGILPDIFDAFVSTRLDARGTGLGLTVAEGIVSQHGGTIAAANRPEGGAALEVCLPAAPKLEEPDTHAGKHHGNA